MYDASVVISADTGGSPETLRLISPPSILLTLALRRVAPSLAAGEERSISSLQPTCSRSAGTSVYHRLREPGTGYFQGA